MNIYLGENSISKSSSIKVIITKYDVNDNVLTNDDLNGITITLTNNTRNIIVETKTYDGSDIIFDNLVPLQDYYVEIEKNNRYYYSPLYSVLSLGINEEFTVNINAILKDNLDYYDEYFTITTTKACTIYFSKEGLYYSTNKTTWSSINTSGRGFSANEIIYFKGNLTRSSTADEGIGTFSGNSSNCCELSGNIMSLIYGDDFRGQTTLPSSYMFSKLFDSFVSIRNTKHLILPATTLSQYCYQYMFNGCSSLITAPELPATDLQYSCYMYMFKDCTSLTEAPELPATTLAGQCYLYMFNGCTSLTTTPELLATTLVSNCYNGMFNNCTKLSSPIRCLALYNLRSGFGSNPFSGCNNASYFIINPKLRNSYLVNLTLPQTNSNLIPYTFIILLDGEQYNIK